MAIPYDKEQEQEQKYDYDDYEEEYDDADDYDNYDDADDYDDYEEEYDDADDYDNYDDADDYDDYEEEYDDADEKKQDYNKFIDKLNEKINNNTVLDKIVGFFKPDKEQDFGNIIVKYDTKTGYYEIVDKHTNIVIGGYNVFGTFGEVKDDDYGKFVNEEFIIDDSYISDDVSYINKETFYGYKTVYTYKIDNQPFMRSIITRGNSFFKLSSDKHYWISINGNREANTIAELLLDITDKLEGTYPNLTRLIKIIDISQTLFFVILPGLNLIGLGNKLSNIDKGLGTIFTLVGGYTTLQGILDINTFAGKGGKYLNSTTDNMLTKGIAARTRDSPLGKQIINNNINLNRNRVISNSIKPNRLKIENKGNIMEAKIADARGGLSDVLKPHLIAGNEAAIYTNISLKNGIIQNITSGEQVTNNLGDTSNNIILPAILGDKSSPLVTVAKTDGIVRLGRKLYFINKDTKFSTYKDIQKNVIFQPFKDNKELVNIEHPQETASNKLTLSNLYGVAQHLGSNLPQLKFSFYKQGNTARQSRNTVQELIVPISVKEAERMLNNDYLLKSYTVHSNPVLNDIMYKDDEYEVKFLDIKIGIYKVPDTTTDKKITNFETKVGAFENVKSFLVTDIVWENFKYAITFYNENNNYESKPLFSESITRKTNNIKIQNIPYPTTFGLKIRLYRLGGYYTNYKLVKEFDYTNTIFDYTDTIEETDEWNFLDTDNIGNVDKLVYLVEHKSMIFGYKDNKVFFTSKGKANSWSNFKFIIVGGDITGLASTGMGLLIFTLNSTFLLSGESRENFVLDLINDTYGCADNSSIKSIKNAAIWYSGTHILVSTGASIQNLTEMKVDLDGIGEIYSSLVHKDIYYLAGQNYTLKIDFRFNSPSFSKLDLSIRALFVYNNILCYLDVANNMNKGFEDGLGQDVNLHYKSLMIVGKDFENLKEFKSVDIVFKGDFNVTIYKNENETMLTTNIKSPNLTTLNIKLPNSSNQALGVQIEFRGKGSIYSYKFIFNDIV